MGHPDWWTNRRFGLLVHANVATVPAWAPLGEYSDWYLAHTDGGVPDVHLHPSPLIETLAHHRDRWAHIEHHDDFVPFLTFEEWDADAWTSLAREAGMGYAVAVAKHHDGWCWWDAPGTDRTLVDTGPRRDVIGEFAAACERADLTFGTMYSLLDWGDPRYGTTSFVDDAVHPQVLDLVERYGSRLLWGNGHWGQGESHWRSNELVAACRAVEPNLVVNDRWWWDGDAVATYEYRLPADIVTTPWEHRRGLGSSFSYNRVEPDDRLLGGAEIVSLLTEVVAKGGHLLLSVGPDAAGRIPAAHAERLRAAGEWIRRHRDLIDRSVPWNVWGDDECRYLVVDDVLHAVDVGGRGRLRALERADGVVASITAVGGRAVAFSQDDRGVRLRLPPGTGRRMPEVYQVEVAPPTSEPITLFGEPGTSPIPLAEAIGDAGPGDIVRLGDGTYLGPARIPDGVTVRGLGPDRTVLEGLGSAAAALGDRSRLEHCAVSGGGDRIVWLPRTALTISGHHATVIGCRVDGHIAITGDEAKVTSCALTGVVATGADRLVVARCHFVGMQWDCGIDLAGGANQLVESCHFDALLVGVRGSGTIAATVRNNSLTTRWWGVQIVDGEATTVTGNSFERTMRAVDIDGGTLAEVSGNAVVDGDSGCVVQRGASECTVAGNHWDRCRIGLLAWDAGSVRHHDNIAVDLLESDSRYVVGP